MYIVHRYTYKFHSKCHSPIVQLPDPRSGDSQGQETFLTPSADNQTRNFETECSNHPSVSTLRSKGLSRSKMKW